MTLVVSAGGDSNGCAFGWLSADSSGRSGGLDTIRFFKDVHAVSAIAGEGDVAIDDREVLHF